MARAAAFGPTDQVPFAAISPDGSTLYFATYPEEKFGPGAGQIRALNLATGRSRVVYTPAGQPGLVTADPAVQNFLLQIQQPGTIPLRLARLDLATAGSRTCRPGGWARWDPSSPGSHGPDPGDEQLDATMHEAIRSFTTVLASQQPVFAAPYPGAKAFSRDGRLPVPVGGNSLQDARM